MSRSAVSPLNRDHQRTLMVIAVKWCTKWLQTSYQHLQKEILEL